MWRYIGKFLNGTIFHKGGFHATIGRGHVIQGIDEGMRGMCIGEKRRLTIHPDLVGNEGAPGVVPKNNVLIYDVLLTNIIRPKQEL